MDDDDDARARTLLQEIPALRRRSDLDLLMFFSKHPRTLISSEQLARFLGYELDDIAQSLDRLLAAGLLTRAQNPLRPPRMYVLVTDAATGEWLRAFVEFASTRAGRLALRRALGDSPAGRTNGLPAQAGSDAGATAGARPFPVRRTREVPEQRPDQPEKEER